MATEITQSIGGAESIAVPPSEAAQTGIDTEIETFATGELKVIRRNGKVTHFDANKIAVAMTKAFLAVEGGSAAGPSRTSSSF